MEPGDEIESMEHCGLAIAFPPGSVHVISRNQEGSLPAHGISYRLSILLAVSMGIVACSDPSGPGNADLQIHAFAHGRAQQSLAAMAEMASLEGASVVSTVRIDRVLLVLGRVKLEKASDWATDFVDERSVVVSLVPDGEPALALTADVPGGRYKELELAFDKLERGKAQEEPLIQQYPGLANASVLIEGKATVNGSEQSFAFASDLDMDVEVLFDPPLSFEGDRADPALLSLVLDVSGWFRDSAGQLLDPASTANRSTIEGNVHRSVHLFEDPERDGR